MNLPPDYSTRSHDESGSGQEELYVRLAGSGWVVLDDSGERLALDEEHLCAVGPGTGRALASGPEGLRVLIVGSRARPRLRAGRLRRLTAAEPAAPSGADAAVALRRDRRDRAQRLGVVAQLALPAAGDLELGERLERAAQRRGVGRPRLLDAAIGRPRARPSVESLT